MGGAGSAMGGAGSAMDGGADGSDAGAVAFVDYRSGTRLRAMFYEVPGGVRVWHGWFDQALGVPCAFVSADDGKLRCLPTGRYVNRFTDDQCTEPVAYVPDSPSDDPTCGPPKFVVQRTNPCGSTFAAWVVGAATTVTSAVKASQDGACDKQAAPDAQGYAVSRKASSDFVSATMVVEARTAELGVTYYEAEDGARQPVSPYDRNRLSPCDAAGGEDEYSQRCVPRHTAEARSLYYSDESCTEQVADVTACAADEVSAVMMIAVTEQPQYYYEVRSYANLGTPVASAHTKLNPLSCQEAASIPALSFFEIGAPIAPWELPKVATVDLGSGRVRARYYASSDGQPLTLQALYDTEIGAPCSPLPSDSGERCFPGDVSASISPSSVLYEDGACLHPSYLVQGDTLVPAYYATPNATTGCVQPEFAEWLVDPSSTGLSVYYKEIGSCVLASDLYGYGVLIHELSSVPSSSLGPVIDSID